MVSALGEVINDGVIHPEEKVKVKVRSRAPIFRCFDVRLAVSDVLRSTPITPSVLMDLYPVHILTLRQQKKREISGNAKKNQIFSKILDITQQYTDTYAM